MHWINILTVVCLAGSLGAQELPVHVRALQSKAAQKDFVAQYQLGEYYDAQAEPAQYVLAVVWFKKSAAAGYVPALVKLGNMYEDGKRVEKNTEEALKCFELAARKGSSDGMCGMGRVHYESVANGGDCAKWFLEAIKKGNREAMWRLGMAYEHGRGVTGSATEAAKWYAAGERFARAGYASSLANNHLEAYKWYKISALLDERDGIRRLEESAAKLTRPQIVAMDKEAQRISAPVIARRGIR